MPSRILKVDDLRDLTSPAKVAKIFQQLGYNASAEPINVESLELSSRSMAAIAACYLIADQDEGGLQVFLFELKSEEWVSASMASTRMKAIASQLGRRPSEFLLLATKDYHQLMLVNPRKSFDDKMTLRASIRKLLIDRQNPTAYDLDRLEAIAVRGKSAQALYKAHCEAFDVEKLTKGFYERYKKLFERVLDVIKVHNPDPYFEDVDRFHQFAQRLLGRIMFLYFLQKKEFLAGDRQFLKTQYKVNKYRSEGTDYYAEILEPLFFETLNEQRKNQDSQWGKVPYLNGGLFDRDYGEGIKDGAGQETPEFITLPNGLFDPGDGESILGFFNGYNFTIAENVAGDEDVAVDPEMLGKVFENMLAAEERGKSGTFYTPRGIVLFMCAEVLARYLVDETGITLETAQKLVDYDPDISTKDLKALISPSDAKKLKEAIATLKVLDPAVGSGAFPLGMMQLILNVRMAVAHREEEQAPKRGTLRISHWKRDIIANNLYGVDIKPEAIEIAKLRMWLSLVVDIPSLDNVQPLPNLDYKLMCGDSLISKINGQTIIPIPGQAEQLTLGFQMNELDRAIADLVQLEKRYFNVSAEERQGLRLEILEAEKRVFTGAIADQRNAVLDQQKQLEREIRALKKPTKKRLKERETLAERLKGLDEFEQSVQRGDRSLNFFQYYLHFRDVFEGKGGFDIVVGNPPYVRQEQIKEIKPALEAEYECYTGRADLFVYFYEQGFRLLKPKGHLTYITSNKYFRAGYGEKLRKYLGDNSIVEIIIDFGDANVFEAIAYPSIIVIKKQKASTAKGDAKQGHEATVLTWQEGQALEDFVSVYGQNRFPLKQSDLKPDCWQLESPTVLNLLKKIRDVGSPLSDYVEGKLFYGIKSGCNKAFEIDEITMQNLIQQDPRCTEIIKPWLRGKNIKRWHLISPKTYLIYTHHGIDIEHYPSVYKHLLKFKEDLEKRATINSHEWYELQQPQYLYTQSFEYPKIVFPDIELTSCFMLDELNTYPDTTAFVIPRNSKYLLGILNSKIILFFYKKISASVQGGYLRYKTQYVSQIPIPKASEEEKKEIEELVEKCLTAKGVGVEEWEAAINEKVAHLYGLTPSEINLIKGE